MGDEALRYVYSLLFLSLIWVGAVYVRSFRGSGGIVAGLVSFLPLKGGGIDTFWLHVCYLRFPSFSLFLASVSVFPLVLLRFLCCILRAHGG